MRECLRRENPNNNNNNDDRNSSSSSSSNAFFLVKQTNDDRFLQNNLSANLSAGDRAVSRTLSVAPTPEPVVAQKS